MYCKYCKTNKTNGPVPGRTWTCPTCRKKVARLRYLHNSIGKDAIIEDALGMRQVKARGADKNLRNCSNPKGEGYKLRFAEQSTNKTMYKQNDWITEYNQLVKELGIYERIELVL